MVLKAFESAQNTDDNTPWANEYLDEGGEEDTASFVTKIVKTPKGLLVIGEDFKGFLFKKSAIYEFLLEAIEAWKSNSTINYPLFAIVLSGGKVTLAVDDELHPTIWIEETKNKIWVQKRKKDKGDGSKVLMPNPFLPTPPPTSTTRKGNTKPSIEAPTTIGH